ncbi:FAD-binding oxidoreductase [Pseudohoeflea suaedae]|uniref:FAD-binding oxidoreductase n=1 Tax=Pseudohoeflea suaedae TaxID=877384 RepID=A0A4R5PPX4_9HYPH|nr:FAD-binding oxidoreductase [Pseudohoeflea suaedae]TDH39079.1 FAD-binding oxidoreductase [Pseudohoeflea suaedae]
MSQFPLGLHAPVEHSAPLPERADVVVIGGGVVGVSTAIHLGRRGANVVLVEKGRVAGEQSSRNWGWIRQQGRDTAELPIMIEARRLWIELAEQSGEDFGLTQGGVTYLARTDAELDGFSRWQVFAAKLGVDTMMLDAAQTAQLIPGMTRTYPGAMTTPSDMRAEPWLAVPALARLAAREGVTIVEECAARALDVEGGRVAGLVTEKGRIAASEVVLAGGAWSSLFLRRHGIGIPQLSVLSSVAATEPMARVYTGGATDDEVAFRLRQDGGYTLADGSAHDFFVGPDAFRALPKYLPVMKKHMAGTKLRPLAPAGYPDAWGTPRNWGEDEMSPFERMRVLDPKPSRHTLKTFIGRFERLFPQLGPVKIKASWGGMIDTLPDIVPIIDRAGQLPGLTIGTGMCGHGFGIGPGVGRVLADKVMGNEIGHDLRRFRLARFSDGSKLDLGPSL